MPSCSFLALLGNWIDQEVLPLGLVVAHLMEGMPTPKLRVVVLAVKSLLKAGLLTRS